MRNRIIPDLWLDRHIEEQREQRHIIEEVCRPYTASELCEIVGEEDEVFLRGEKRKKEVY